MKKFEKNPNQPLGGYSGKFAYFLHNLLLGSTGGTPDRLMLCA